MFGINKSELINNLEILRKNLCCYNTSEICDCKFGPEIEERKGLYSKISLTENTGYPELRQVIEILSVMSKQEFNELNKRAGLLIN